MSGINKAGKNPTFQFVYYFWYMNKQRVIETLKNEKPFLQQQFGVEEIALFGSYARDEAKPGSDVDILIKMNDKSLRGFIGVIEYLQDKLQLKIDIVLKTKFLSKQFSSLIAKDLIYV